MKKKRLFVSIMAGLLALLMIGGTLVSIIGSAMAVSQTEIDALKDQRSGIESKKADIQTQIADLQARQETVIEQKTKLDEQNELTRQEIEIIVEQIALYTDMISQKEVELEEAVAAEEEQMERLRTRMRAMEENGTLTYMSIVFKATSFTDFLTRLDFVSEIMQYDKQLEEDYIAAREHVEDVKAAYEITKAENEAVKGELEETKARLEREIEEAYQLIAQYEAEIEEQKELYQKQIEEEARLEAEIANMVAELERQIEAARQAAAAGNSGGTGWTGAITSGTGQLQWPVYGTVTSEYGNRIHPIYGNTRFHAGIDISASSGTAIAAADSGTVITASYNAGGYGNYVVISHGGGISTLYGHMTNYIVSVGQSVSKGETIGYVGSTGASTGPHLHFEVRINGSTTNPRNYL